MLVSIFHGRNKTLEVKEAITRGLRTEKFGRAIIQPHKRHDFSNMFRDSAGGIYNDTALLFLNTHESAQIYIYRYSVALHCNFKFDAF